MQWVPIILDLCENEEMCEIRKPTCRMVCQILISTVYHRGFYENQQQVMETLICARL